MSKTLKNLAIATFATTAAIVGFNKFVEYEATKKKLTVNKSDNYFVWKYGDIYYKKKGNGDPILLIHDLHPASSSYEWSKIINSLAKYRTVYAIDLLGCGKSDKPNINYVNYVYVQVISDFIKNIIGSKTDVVVTGDSFSATIMAARMNPNLIGKITAINPLNPVDNCISPDKKSEMKKNLLRMPIVGTFIYNNIANNISIKQLFKKQYYHDKSKISDRMTDIYFECSHLKGSSGKNLYASILGRYTNINIIYAIQHIDNPIDFIITDGYDESEKYLIYNSNIEIHKIEDCGYLPQMECPTKVLSIL